MSTLPIISAFLSYLTDERHFSPYTARCYGADLRQFLEHLVDESGQAFNEEHERTVFAQMSDTHAVGDGVAGKIIPNTITQTICEADADLLNGFPDTAELLGKRTAEMHAALADADDEAFEPEPLSKLYLRSLYQTLRNGIRRPMQTLASGAARLTGEAAELAQRVVARRDEMIERIGLVRELPLEGARIRCHGDYHLGQVLWTGADFYIIDFEGEPMRTLGERRLKRTALSDVAGMCRSLDYAAHAGLRRLESQGLAEGPTANDASLSTLAERWSTHATAAFLRGYFGSVREGLTPASTDATARLLDAWTMHKAAYEVQYELNNRPDWITIPLRGILTILGDTERSKPD